MKRRYHPLKELILVRMREFYREPEVIFWVYIFPILLVVGLGLAFGEAGGTKVRVLVAAEEHPSARERCEQILEVLSGQHDLDAAEIPLSRARAPDSRNPPDLVVIAGPDGVRYVFDPARAGSQAAYQQVDRLLQEAAGRQDELPATVEHLQQPGSRYIDWLVPGLLGMNIMGGGLWGVGFVSVDLRMRKLLKRYIATPMRRSHFLLALMGSRLLFLIPEMAIILLVAYFAFGVGVQGNLLGLMVVILAGAISFAGLGLFVGCRAQRIETISGLLNVVMMPMWILSGIFFSSERFPDAMQPFVQALPLTQLNNALRAIMLEGAPLHSQWLPLAALALWGGLCFPAALRWFKWQ
jgi:ABC-type multidrug transport system permease subunit